MGTFTGIVYLIQNMVNLKIYIGITTKALKNRLAQHSCLSRSGRSDRALHRAIDKYGAENFKAAIIDTASSLHELRDKECLWIQRCGCVSPRGYNLTDGGDGVFNPSAETRKKMADAARRNSVLMRPEVRARNIAANTGRPAWNKGKTWSEETIAKLSASHKGIKQSEETRRKRAIANSISAQKRTSCKRGHEYRIETTRLKKSKGVFGEKTSRFCVLCARIRWHNAQGRKMAAA